MHGSVLDWLVTHTVKDGLSMLSGEGLDSSSIQKDGRAYPFLPNLSFQPEYKNVLDIGGQDVNGSPRTYDFFGRGPKWLELVGNPKYTSIDILQKPGVDLIVDAHNLSDNKNYELMGGKLFDLILCLEVLEHDSDPAATIREAYKVLAPGGALILTCAGYLRPAHDIHGGDGQPYNFIYPWHLAQWLTDAGFRYFKLDSPAGDLRVYAEKEVVK